MNIYIVVDTVGDSIANVVCAPTDLAAQRVCDARDWPPGSKANDFNLIFVGHMDERTDVERGEYRGKIYAVEVPKLVGTFPSADVPVRRNEMAFAKMLAAAQAQQGVSDGE